MAQHFQSADELVDALIASVGKTIVLGLPIGIGKAIHVANALYRRAVEDRSLSLKIFTGLTLEKPRFKGGLEERLAGPVAQRLYGSWPETEYAKALQTAGLPPNVEVREFYLRPGAFLGNERVQQNYTSINYSKVADALIDLGVNVIAQLVTAESEDSAHYSLGGNPEVTLDLLPAFVAQREAGRRVAMVGQLNSCLPYMPGDARIDAHQLDFLLVAPELDHPLFALPNRRVMPADYATGMHVASLIPDGGTLQVGIGSLSDAVAHCLRLRHEQPALFAEVLAALPGGSSSAQRTVLPIEDQPFKEGLYACTELLSDALFSLFSGGIIKRPADETDDTLIHAGFFLGSGGFYEALRTLDPERRRRICMTRISFVNTLFGEEQKKRAQRRQGRFVNETMMATLLGAAVSDGLADGRVVSGVGGQFDFVRMGAELDDAHSILMLRARRERGGIAQSNFRWSYGHTTVPRHMRDVYVSEYGVAATRGQTDQQVIRSMLQIADSKFQPDLVRQAQSAGKLPRDFELAPAARNNTPDAIHRVFARPEIRAAFPAYPMGSELTSDEQVLAVALETLQERTQSMRGKFSTVAGALNTRLEAANQSALERMGLHEPGSMRERLLRRLVNFALQETRP